MKKYKWLVPTIYIIFLMLPIYWLINMSFKTTTEIINTYSLWPQKFTIENYVKIFTDSTWYMGYVNSITYTVFNTVISVAAALPAAIVGTNILKKNLPNEYPSTYAVSSNSLGTADIKPSNIQTAKGILNKQCDKATAI